MAGAGLDELTLTYGGAATGGPRVYLIEEEGVNKNTLFMLHGKEFTFEVRSWPKSGLNLAYVGLSLG